MKGIQQIPGLRNIKSMHSAGGRSIPKVQRSGYLELYVLGRERERLEKEFFILEKRKRTIDRELESINKRMEKLKKEIIEEGKNIKTYRKIPPKLLKKMAINY